MPAAPAPSPQSIRWLVIAGLAALWGQLYLAAVPIWRFGEYYSYGWFVPPFAVFFFYRRWHDLPEEALVPRSDKTAWVVGLALLLLPLFSVLRALNYVDAGWRPPLLLHALVVVVVCHLLLGRFFGWKVTWFFTPVTIFALSAIPWPWQVEQILIRRLTGLVVGFAAELFNLAGRPVEVVGERLESMGTSVSVTDACSGVRSFQNLVMASLFFGEMFFLRLWPRIGLLAVGHRHRRHRQHRPRHDPRRDPLRRRRGGI